MPEQETATRFPTEISKCPLCYVAGGDTAYFMTLKTVSLALDSYDGDDANVAIHVALHVGGRIRDMFPVTDVIERDLVATWATQSVTALLGGASIDRYKDALRVTELTYECPSINHEIPFVLSFLPEDLAL